MDKDASFAGSVLGFCLSLVFTVVQGFVIMKVWNWHMVPLVGMQAMGLGPAVGLSCLADAFMMGHTYIPAPDDSTVGLNLYRLFVKFIGLGITLLIAWIVS